MHDVALPFCVHIDYDLCDSISILQLACFSIVQVISACLNRTYYVVQMYRPNLWLNICLHFFLSLTFRTSTLHFNLPDRKRERERERDFNGSKKLERKKVLGAIFVWGIEEHAFERLKCTCFDIGSLLNQSLIYNLCDCTGHQGSSPLFTMHYMFRPLYTPDM